MTTNIGQIRNKGLEVTLNTVNIDTKDFKWTTDFMFSVNKEEIVELYNGKVDDEGNKWFIGQPVKVFYDYKADGNWKMQPNSKSGEASLNLAISRLSTAMATIRSLPKTALFSVMRIRT